MQKQYMLVLCLWLGSLLGAGQSALASELNGVKPVMACEQLLQQDFTSAADANVTLRSAHLFKTEQGTFCQVSGQIAPAIGFELNLPVERWTQRFLQEGCGGLCGNINLNVGHASSCLPALKGELAVAASDLGHQGGMMDASWADDPQKRIDFAYRANHQTALVSKAIIRAYYGQPARYAYFMGCSDGGREALMEAQRFPTDFDGISAGAPAAFFQFQNSFFHGWNVQANLRADGSAILLKDRLPLLHQAVLAHCPTLSGVEDGLLQNPYACQFSPDWVKLCPEGKAGADCLTLEEVQAAERLYQGAEAADGQHFVLGGLPLGSELRWPVPTSAHAPSMSEMMVLPALQHVLLDEAPGAIQHLADFPLNAANFQRVAKLAPLYNAANTNLKPFMQHGGKLIMWHGLADDSVSPAFSLAYYRGVQAWLGEQATDRFMRLFLLPGVGHCGRGEGYDQIDLLSLLMAWTEAEQAPQQLMTAKVTQPAETFLPSAGRKGPLPPPGKPDASAAAQQFHGLAQPSSPLATPAKTVLATRPVFPYPQLAVYSGEGDPKLAANYQAVKSAAFEQVIFGQPALRFIGPDNQQDYEVKQGKLVVRH